MKTNAIISAILLACTGFTSINAQILKKLERKFDQKVNEKVDQLGNKVIDKTFGKAEKVVDKVDERIDKKSKKKNSSESSTQTSEQRESTTVPQDYFFSDDFSSYEGVFPKNWGTNIGGTVVTMDEQEGYWLKVTNNAIVYPKIEGPLPQNFSITFDLIYPTVGLRPPVTFGFSELKNPTKMKLQKIDILYFIIPASIKQNVGYSNDLYSGRETFVKWAVDQHVGKKLEITINVEGSHVQLLIDGNKIFDLPDGFDKDSYRNSFHFRAAPLVPNPKDAFYISNFRMTEF